ncbi:serine hydrolase domain-containing protein [Mesobacterium pallidum]|uniref:serine hydrolase domain-containing protein n=1 Tax=Mesobacterium pallidum TaxID=2872037 RepID=UPI001EE22C8C|nr:serine hydrolase domain-containing protein [Mesobacterium pallidum]
MHRAIFNRGELGIQVAAYLNGELVIDAWAGIADPHGSPVNGDTLFNVFSVTKAVASTAVHLQAERGLIDYDAPIVRYWPEFGAHGKQTATVRDALTHRTGIPQMPDGTSPEMICDWDRMCAAIADLAPIFPVGGDPAYHSMTYGWIVGEIVRRTDPGNRPFGTYVQDEICQPLNIRDLWLGIPERVEPRIAVLRNDNASDPLPPLESNFIRSVPSNVQLVPPVFERPDVRRACIPAVGGIANARSMARFWAMLAEGGTLDGTRLLSPDRVASASRSRQGNDRPDPVYFDMAMPLSEGGFWKGQSLPPIAAVRDPEAICCPGAGGSIAWADRKNRLAVAICHNRMLNLRGSLDHPLVEVADAIRETLGHSKGN